ncbi:MAG: non-canonical purine NTP pyrophosphatase [Gemmatimonadaceae bacterium]|nr:non-canonical purine NTP pyrophosphatase [Gemmatimonadaceae bacterium]
MSGTAHPVERRLLLATRSAGKLRELAPLLREAGYVPVDLETAGIPEAPTESAIEAHDTFEANALAKARHFFAVSGIPTLADDSGLCVDALGGRPGVRSKRWSARHDLTGQALDDANNAALLAALTADMSRAAAYVCAAAYVDDDGELVRRGEVRGTILAEARGTGGFGYDPYFLSHELEQTFAEVTREEKARVSHRARAVRAVLSALGANAAHAMRTGGR